MHEQGGGCRSGRGQGGAPALPTAQIRGHGRGDAAGRLNGGHDLTVARLIDVDAGDLGTLPRQRHGDGTANIGGRSRHQRLFAGEQANRGSIRHQQRYFLRKASILTTLFSLLASPDSGFDATISGLTTGPSGPPASRPFSGRGLRGERGFFSSLPSGSTAAAGASGPPSDWPARSESSNCRP